MNVKTKIIPKRLKKMGRPEIEPKPTRSRSGTLPLN